MARELTERRIDLRYTPVANAAPPRRPWHRLRFSKGKCPKKRFTPPSSL